MSGAPCMFCESLGGNVSSGALLEEWGAVHLTAALVARVRSAHGGAAYLGRRDALGALAVRLRAGECEAADGLAAFAVGWRREDYEVSDALLAGLLRLLPLPMLAQCSARACARLDGVES